MLQGHFDTVGRNVDHQLVQNDGKFEINVKLFASKDLKYKIKESAINL